MLWFYSFKEFSSLNTAIPFRILTLVPEFCTNYCDLQNAEKSEETVARCDMQNGDKSEEAGAIL
jgi:hypothetical protein